MTKLQAGKSKVCMPAGAKGSFPLKHPDQQWGLVFVGTRHDFPDVKWSVCKADHLLPCSAEVKNERFCTFAPPHAFLTCIGGTFNTEDHHYKI